MSEHTGRDIRWRTLGFSPRDIDGRRQQRAQATEGPGATTPELVCRIPFAGLWLLVSYIIDSGLVQAACLLRTLRQTRVQSMQSETAGV